MHYLPSAWSVSFLVLIQISGSYSPGWQTRALRDRLLPVSQDHPLASEREKSNRRRVYCPIKQNLSKKRKQQTQERRRTEKETSGGPRDTIL